MSTQTAEVVLVEDQAEREEIFALRYEIYVREMGKSPPEADHQNGWIRDDFDLTARLYGLKSENGEIVGTLRFNLLKDVNDPEGQLSRLSLKSLLSLLQVEQISVTSRLMLKPSWRGGGVLGLLLNECYGYAVSLGIRADICHVKPGLVELYEQMGYRRFCPGFNLDGVGYQVPMVLALLDRDHLKRSRSPLLRHPACRNSDPNVDSCWINRLGEEYRGLNHRLVNSDQFWAQAEKALCNPDLDLPLFRDLSEEQSRSLLRTGTVLQCEAGDTVIHRGDPQNDLYVILEGVAEVWRMDKDRRLCLALLKAGDVFGEMGFLGRPTRSADVVATTPIKILILSQKFLNRSIHQQPFASALLLRNLSLVLAERLSQTTDHLWQLNYVQSEIN